MAPIVCWRSSLSSRFSSTANRRHAAARELRLHSSPYAPVRRVVRAPRSHDIHERQGGGAGRILRRGTRRGCSLGAVFPDRPAPQTTPALRLPARLGGARERRARVADWRELRGGG